MNKIEIEKDRWFDGEECWLVVFEELEKEVEIMKKEIDDLFERECKWYKGLIRDIYN